MLFRAICKQRFCHPIYFTMQYNPNTSLIFPWASGNNLSIDTNLESNSSYFEFISCTSTVFAHHRRFSPNVWLFNKRLQCDVTAHLIWGDQ